MKFLNVMKIEWGKKICCPACALPFYSMQKTSLECPSCGNKFDISSLSSKKSSIASMDEVVENDEQIVLEKFDLEENFDVDTENDTSTDDDELLDDEDVSKVVLVDGDD